jgi:hypothetical protein
MTFGGYNKDYCESKWLATAYSSSLHRRGILLAVSDPGISPTSTMWDEQTAVMRFLAWYVFRFLTDIHIIVSANFQDWDENEQRLWSNVPVRKERVVRSTGTTREGGAAADGIVPAIILVVPNVDEVGADEVIIVFPGNQDVFELPYGQVLFSAMDYYLVMTVLNLFFSMSYHDRNSHIL